MWRSLVIALVLSTTACASAPPRSEGPAWQSGSTWHADTLAIAAGTSNQARREAIEARLSALGISFEQQAFQSQHGQGINVLAALPDTRRLPVLLIGAHYDRVAVGQGAVDNASGCATVLDLAAALLRRPLAHHRVVIAFWDQEELGLLGSKAFVKHSADPNGSAARSFTQDLAAPLALYLNFDVFGYGDTIWGMVPEGQAGFGDAMRAASSAAGARAELGQAYPPTDHQAFLAAGLPAVSLSLVGGDEIPHILEGFAGRRPAVLPKVLDIIHSPGDLPVALDAPAVVQALPIVLAGVRGWDAGPVRESRAMSSQRRSHVPQHPSALQLRSAGH